MIKFSSSPHRIVLRAGLAYSISFIVYASYMVNVNGYLPSPFFYDRFDPFMDFFNIAYQAISGDAYSSYKVFYSPLILTFLSKIIGNACANSIDSVELRRCGLDIYLISVLIEFLLIGILLKVIIGSRKNANWWLVLFMLSFPMMFAIERGNLILLSLLATSFLILLKNEVYRGAVFSLISITKYYMLILVIPYMIARKFRLFGVFIFTFLILHLIFGELYGDGNWVKIPLHIKSFATNANGTIDSLWANTSIFPMLTKLGSVTFDLPVLFVSYLFASYLLWRYLSYLIHINIRSRDSLMHALMVTLIFLLVFTSAAGYYSIILLYPFYCYFLMREMFSEDEKIIIILSILPYPFLGVNLISKTSVSYFNGSEMNYMVALGVHSFIPPILLTLLFYKLTSWEVKHES